MSRKKHIDAPVCATYAGHRYPFCSRAWAAAANAELAAAVSEAGASASSGAINLRPTSWMRRSEAEES